MAKKKLEFVDFSSTALSNEKVTLFEKEVEVKTVIDWNTQQVLISSYLKRMFGVFDNPFGEFTSDNRFLAETALRSDFLKNMTDINVDLLPETLLLDDDFFNHFSPWC